MFDKTCQLILQSINDKKVMTKQTSLTVSIEVKQVGANGLAYLVVALMTNWERFLIKHSSLICKA